MLAAQCMDKGYTNFLSQGKSSSTQTTVSSSNIAVINLLSLYLRHQWVLALLIDYIAWRFLVNTQANCILVVLLWLPLYRHTKTPQVLIITHQTLYYLASCQNDSQLTSPCCGICSCCYPDCCYLKIFLSRYVDWNSLKFTKVSALHKLCCTCIFFH